jgi:hypothetical protein
MRATQFVYLGYNYRNFLGDLWKLDSENESHQVEYWEGLSSFGCWDRTA